MDINFNFDEVSNTSLLHETINSTKDEHLFSGAIHNENINKNIVSSLTENWYQKDLAHMTTSLMQAETNSTTALNTTISPSMMSRSASFNDNAYGGYYPNDWGGVDLSGLGNFFGNSSGSYKNKPDVIKIEKAAAYDVSKSIFHNVFGRDPTQKEWDSAAGSVFGYTEKDHRTRNNDLQKKLANSKEGHDRISNIGIDVLGYTPDEKWIQQEQAKLAKYGTTQQDIRNDFANSQIAYDQYANMATNMLGYNVDETTVHNMQTQTAIEAQQNLVEKQGMIATQQQFNQVADNIKVIQKYFPDFRVDENRFLNYQRMVGDNISLLNLQKFMMQDFVNDNHITNYNGKTFDYSIVPDVPLYPEGNVNIRYAIFSARYDIGTLLDIGKPSQNGQNISSDAVRFSTAGEEGIDRGGKALGTFQKFDEVDTTLKDGSVVKRGPGDGTQVNAARHVLWSAIMTSQKGVNIAKEIGDIHETHPNADTTKRIFDKLADADEIVDLLNNQIGREIGTQYDGPQTAKTLANRMLDEFYRNGFYTINKIESGQNAGKYEVIKTKINIEQYNYMKNEYTKLDDFGF